MNNQYEQVEEYVLNLLESGIQGRLPAARRIAQEISVSFPAVQSTLNTLARKGLLEIRPRQGVFVRENWQERILDYNFTFFRNDMNWKNGLRDIVRSEIPEIRFCKKFVRGMFELRTTLSVQQNFYEFRDLSGFLPGNMEDFFSVPFRDFIHDGKIFGIPWVFSPRVLYCNKKLLRQNGVELPSDFWNCEEFLRIVKELRKHLKGEEILNWSSRIYYWMNFVARSGGALIDYSAADADPVQIDSPATRRGIAYCRELGEVLNISSPNNIDYMERFRRGELCFSLDTRGLGHWLSEEMRENVQILPLPCWHDGKDLSMQATELLCVRKECVDDDLIRRFIHVMLSPEVQEFIGRAHYGIPVLKEAAFKSLDIEKSSDAVFLSQLSKLTANYNLASPELSSVISSGIASGLSGEEDLETVTAELASLARTFLKYKGGKL